MSAFLDALAGSGYDGSETGGIGSVGVAQTDANGGGYFSGIAQSMAAIGTGALSKWVDLELYQKAMGMQPQPNLGTTQNGIFVRQAGLPTAGAVGAVQNQGATLLNLNALLPFVLVGVAVYVFTRNG